ncbi:MAG: hypothetical protein A6F71_09815 [Cycloclasticus sp. symbiont of Poecilosclerida sp. M]|nr:MAG: hypothetical protein A6F71_09815 [Cycloclasticus sp. symbiont of Poecilosclerida sp. M]
MNSLASANTAIIEDGKKVMSIAEGNEVHTYDPIQPLYVIVIVSLQLLGVMQIMLLFQGY